MSFHKDLIGLDLHSPSTEAVTNESGSTITQLKVVKFDGTSGTSGDPLIVAISSASDTPRGIVSADILTTEDGTLSVFGFLTSVDTSSFIVGDILYSDTSGDLTTSTTTGLKVAEVLVSNATTGVLYVAVAGPKGADGASGETNTGSNVGVGGVGVFDGKVGVDLQFKNINAGSSKISVTDDAGNAEIDIDAVEANFTLDSIGGTLSISKGGTGQTTQTPAFDALAPTTTKADIIVHNGTDNIRLGVGTDGQVLTADSAEVSGLIWSTSGGGSETTWNFTGAISSVGANSTNTASWGHNAGTAGPAVLRNGEIIGISVSMSQARSSGTCTVSSQINGVAQTGIGETTTIDASNTITNFQVIASPIAYSAGDVLNLQTVTVSFSPSGSDATMVLYTRDT